MLGGRRATTPLLVLVLSVLAEKQLLVEANTCLCKEDFTPDIIQAISEFSHENLVDRVHTYTGAKSVNNKYEPCICEDVTRLEVKLSTPRNDVDLTEEETTSLVANMTSELYQRFPIDVTDGDFITDLDLISYNVTSEITATSFNFVVLVTLRGRNSSYSNLPEPITLPSSDSTLTLNSVTVLQCAGDPPAPLTNGKDNTAEGKLAGAKAHYTCDTGFMLSMSGDRAVSVCDHETLTWTALPADLTCMEDRRCHSDPPVHVHTSSNWDKSERSDGTVLTYTCLSGYKPTGETSAVSTCKSKAWTSIPDTFKCEYNGCSENPPQVSDYVTLTWNSELHENTQAIYSCSDGYMAVGLITEAKLVCQNKTWGSVPSDFKCVTNDGSYVDEKEIFYESSFLLTVTIPSVAGLIFAIICCLCCTRTDSPLCCICSSKSRQSDYP